METTRTKENVHAVGKVIKKKGDFWGTYGVWLPIVLIPTGMLLMVLLSIYFGW